MTSFLYGDPLTYDANGNLTSDGNNTYTWDARNHLSAISGAPPGSFAYVYDALNRRASKAVAGTTTQFLYDGLNPVQELQSGSASANLLTGLNLDEYFQRTDSTVGTRDYLTDALGSTWGLADSSGTVQGGYSYWPFGSTTPSGTPGPNPYQYTGRENDSGAGPFDGDLYYNRARYYSPVLQRFMSQDPIGFAGGDANLYAYDRNEPINLRDPLGLWSITIGGYWGWGGSLTFGQNPNGTNFVSLGGGAGAGGGITYNPNGTSPGYRGSFSPHMFPSPGLDFDQLPCRTTGTHVTIGPLASLGLDLTWLGLNVNLGTSFGVALDVPLSSPGDISLIANAPGEVDSIYGGSGESGISIGGGGNYITITKVW